MNTLHLLVSLAGLATGLVAQGTTPPDQVIATHFGVLPVAGTTEAVDPLSVPQPPRAVFAAPPPKQTPALRFVPGAAPDLLPGQPTAPGDGLAPLAGPLVVADNHPVNPAGASQGQINEPTTIIHRDTALYTGNWFAALSTSAGRTWTHINPYTKFPASDGGFCCDQVAHYVPGSDATCMAIWLLQYSFSSVTGTNRYRIAIANGRANLRAETFIYYDIGPGLAGYPTNTWFDFPHVSHTNQWLYITANVFNQNSVFQGTAAIRLRLAEMRQGASTPFNIATTNNSAPGSLRLADGATTTMYYGTHVQSFFGAPMIRIFSWDDAATTPTSRDVGISAWYNTASSSIGPDGRDWLAGDDHRILGCYLASGALSFMWGSAAGGSFPRPFVRIVGFSPSTGFNLVGEASVWSSSVAWAYPSVAGNARGDVGGTICFGGAGFHPGAAVWVVDAQSSWGPLTNTTVASGGRGPGSRWGDYFSATRHPQYPNTYVGTGYTLDANGNATPRFAWFGRQEDLPNFATVNVTSTPITGVPITVDVPDRNGQQNGTTSFVRTYSGVQGMTWTAPAQVVSGGARYDFDRWRFNASLQPVGQRDLVIDDLQGAVSNAVEARYARRRHTLSVTSTPTNGTTFSLSPPDFQNRIAGTTPANIEYEDNVTFRITANIAHNGALFDRWIVDGSPRAPGFLSLDLTATGNHALVAAYRIPVCGSLTAFGQSCNTQFPGLTHTATTARTPCGPFYNEPVTYGVQNALLNSAGVLIVGASRTSWNGFALPLPVPGQPGCSIQTDMVLFLSFGIGGTGAGGANVVLPFDRSLANTRLYTQVLVVNPLGVTQWSNGIETLIGGFP